MARGATEEALEIAADSLAESFPQVGYEPLGAPPVDRHTVNLLRLGPERCRPPEPTLGDALRLYLKEHLKADSPETDSRVVGLATRVVEAAIAAIGRDPLLTAITPEDARAVRDHMLDRVKATGKGTGTKVSAATVSRELAILSAVVNFAKVEFGMPDTMPNPFSRLPVARVAKGQGQKASEKRDPLPPAVLTKTRARVLANAAPEGLHRAVGDDPERHETAGQKERLAAALGGAVGENRLEIDRKPDDEPDIAGAKKEHPRQRKPVHLRVLRPPAAPGLVGFHLPGQALGQEGHDRDQDRRQKPRHAPDRRLEADKRQKRRAKEEAEPLHRVL